MCAHDARRPRSGSAGDAVRVLAPYRRRRVRRRAAGLAARRSWPRSPRGWSGRPVKLVLTRPQMFTSIGHRPQSRSASRLGATATAELVAIDHEAPPALAIEDDNFEPVTMATAIRVRLPERRHPRPAASAEHPVPGSMRAPGEGQGNFALESALDELAYELGIDPLELRLRNYAEVHPQSGCRGRARRCASATRSAPSGSAGRRRDPEVGSMRDGRWLVGYGMAGVTFGWYQAPCQARTTIEPRRDRARAQRRDRHRHRHVHGRDAARRRAARP